MPALPGPPLIAQGVCAGLSMVVIMARLKHLEDEPGHEDEGKRPLFHFSAVERIARIGVPSMIQQSIVSISMLMMQGLVNSYGSVFIAGYTAANQNRQPCHDAEYELFKCNVQLYGPEYRRGKN